MADFLKSAGGILATLAPTVASVLGGPLAGMATTAIISAFGLAPDASQDDIMKAVSAATPDQMIKLKEIESKLIIDLKALDVDLERINAGDRDSARKREIATNDWTPRILASLIIGLYIGVQYFIFGGHVLDPGMRDIAMRSLGTLDAAVGLVLAYYFGSSNSSKQKTDHLASLAIANKDSK
jgi:hypothetical protein